MQLEMGTLWGSRVLLCSPIGSVLVRVSTDSLGSKSITETTGEMEVERIREPLEEEEAVLLGSSDEYLKEARSRSVVGPAWLQAAPVWSGWGKSCSEPQQEHQR